MTSPAGDDTAVWLRWLGQAGFELRAADGTVVFDPFASPFPGRRVPAMTSPTRLRAATAILVSHEHADHFDLPLLADTLTAGRGPLLILPEPLVAAARAAGLPQDRLRPAQPGTVLTVGDLRVDPVAAKHGVHVSDSYNFGTAISAGRFRYLGYVVTLGAVKVYHAGDTLDHSDLAGTLKTLGVDVALLPINGRDRDREAEDLVGNLTAEEAADLAARCGARVVIPMHFDMFAGNPGDPDLFAALVAHRCPQLRVVIPQHGIEVNLKALLS